jgi:hypothetical protein
MANRVVLMLEAAGLPASENQHDFERFRHRYSSSQSASVAPMGASGKADGKFEGAAVGAAIGAKRRPQPAATMLAIPGVGAVVRAGWLAAMLGSMAIGGVAGGLLGELAGISEEDAQVFVEGVRRGGTLIAARVPQTELPPIEAMMNQSTVDLRERRNLYRKSGWQCFDPNAVPYSADQVRSERALHAH